MAIQAQCRAGFKRTPKGDDAVTYRLIPSVTSIKKSFAGVTTPASISCEIFKITGATTPLPTKEVTLKYQRSTDAALRNYTTAITTSNFDWIEFTAWKGNVLLDRQTIPVQTDASDMELGSRNIVLNSGEKITSRAYLIKNYKLSTNLQKGKTYTIVLKATCSQGTIGLWINGGGTQITPSIPSIATGLLRYTFTLYADLSDKKTINLYNYPSSVVHNSTIEWIKLVEGNTTSNDWVAAPEDDETKYSSLVEVTDQKLEAVLTQTTKENLIAKALASGKCLYPDATFSESANGVLPYKNSSTGTLTATRTYSALSPTGSNYVIKVRSLGATPPQRGGVVQNMQARANAIFIQRFIAKIPKGFSVWHASNNVGLNSKFEWLTPYVGTGEWQEYLLCITCGTSSGASAFSTCGHLYITGGVQTTLLEWEIALMTAYDITSSSYLVNNELLNSVKNTLQSSITANANIIATKVSRTDYNANNTVINQQFTEIKQTATNVSLKVSTLETLANKPQGMQNFALGTKKMFEISGFLSAENNCFNTFKVRKEVTGGDVCLAFDIELTGCIFTTNSRLDIQADGDWDWNAGVSGWGAIPAKNVKTHVFVKGNIPTKTKDGFIQIRTDYVKGGSIKITNFMYTKGHKELNWVEAPEDTQAKMIETGIDIENRKLTFTADNTTFKDNAGNVIALFNAKGINANLINTKELSVERLICYNNNGEKLYSVNEANDGCPKFYYPNGVVMKEDVFTYDNAGNVNGLETRYYDSTGQLKWKTTDSGNIVTEVDIRSVWHVLNGYYLASPPTAEQITYLKRLPRIESNITLSKFNTTEYNDDLLLEMDYNNRLCFGAKTNQNPTSIPSSQWVTGYVLDDKTNYAGDKPPDIIALRDRYLRRYVSGRLVGSGDISINDY